jgi:lipopolysaccharide export LptBFGC system permease protein LptF
MRLKLLDRYLFRELAAPFLIGLAGFLTVLCLNMVYFVLDLIVDKDAPIREITGIIMLRVPFYLVLALPVAVLLASSLAVNRLTRDRELTAFRLAGLPLWRVLAPYAALGLLLSVGSFAAEEWLSPIATHASDNMYRRLVLESSVPSMTPDTFFRSDNRVFYFHNAYRTGSHQSRLEQVLMFQVTPTGFPEIWSAREALVEGDTWMLRGVVMHRLDEQGRASVDAVPPDQVVLDLHKDLSFLMEGQKLPEEMTAAQLGKQIRDYDRTGIRGAFVSSLQYEYWSKFALPAACLICAIIGIPLNIRYARLGGFVGLFLALVAVFI